MIEAAAERGRARGAGAGETERPRRVRLFRALLYGLIFASSGSQLAIVPILPVYAHRLGLTGLAQGALLSATGLATLVFCLPTGAFSDRVGARGFTLWAGALMAAALFAQAVAPSFPILFGSRLVFGLGFGMIWTAGLSWLASVAPGGSSLGGSVASAGAGGAVGPALASAGVQYVGLTVPFLAATVVFALITTALGLLRVPAPAAAPGAPVSARLRATVGDCRMIWAAAAIVTAGVTTGVSALLVPERLHATGASPGEIGLAFSVAGALFVAGSTLTAAAGGRAVRTPVAFAGMVALALAISPVALTLTPWAVVTMLCATTAARSVLWTVSYPLAAAGAQRRGAGLGVVMGLLNGVWAATALLSPLLAGLAAEHVGPQAVFATTEAACVAVLAATVVLARRTRHPDQSVPAAVARPRVSNGAARPASQGQGCDDED